MLISGPDQPVTDPLRALAFVLAACADRWDNVVQVHQQTLAKHPPTTPFRELATSAVAQLQPLLEQQARLATAQADALLHAVVQPGRDALASNPQVLAEDGQRLLARIAASDESTRRLLEGRYRHQLSGEMLAQQLGIPSTGLAKALAEARAQVDGQPVPTGAANLGPMPALFEDYLAGTLDPDSRALLVRLTQDLAGLTRFQRQHRQHLLLCAAYAHLPFPPMHGASEQASNRTRVRTEPARLNPPRRLSDVHQVSSGHRTAMRAPTVVAVVVGGCLVVVIGFMLLREVPAGQPARASEPVATATPVTTTDPPTPVTQPAVTPAAPPAPARAGDVVAPAARQSPAIALLPLVDPARDADGPAWRREADRLRVTMAAGSLSYLQLPYRPPAEFDLVVRYRRQDEMGGMVAVIVPHRGAQVVAYISFQAWQQKKIIGFGLVDRLGIWEAKNPTRVAIGGGDQYGRQYEGVIRVRQNSIRIDYEGHTSEWTAPMGGLMLEKQWQTIDAGTLGLAVGRGTTEFEQVTLQPLSDGGEELRPVRPVRERVPVTDKTVVPPPPAPPTTATVPAATRTTYATVRDDLFHQLANGMLTAARSRLDQAFADPAFATWKPLLELDRACLDLQATNLAAVPRGAGLLSDGRAFTLEETGGRKLPVGRGSDNRITAADETGMTVEQQIGSGRVQLTITYDRLTAATRAALGREALATRPDADLHAAMGALLLPLGQPSVSTALIRAWLKKAAARAEQAPLAAHLLARLDELEALAAAERRTAELEQQANGSAPKAALTAITALQNELGDSLGAVRLRPRLEAVRAVAERRSVEVEAATAARRAAEAERARELHVWDFSTGKSAPWTAANRIEQLTITDGALTGTITGDDAYLVAANLAIDLPVPALIELTWKANRAGGNEVFWECDRTPGLHREGFFTVNRSDTFTVVTYDLSRDEKFRGKLTSLRLDLLNGSEDRATFAISRIRILRK